MRCDFLFREGIYNVFAFDCPGCGQFGEIGIPDNRMGQIIEHDCGALFIERPAIGMFSKPTLVEISRRSQA